MSFFFPDAYFLAYCQQYSSFHGLSDRDNNYNGPIIHSSWARATNRKSLLHDYFFNFDSALYGQKFKPIQAKRSKSGREYFLLGAESYASLGRVEKKREEKSVSSFRRFRLWTSFESSPVSVKILLT